jgi:hypothetical protein
MQCRIVGVEHAQQAIELGATVIDERVAFGTVGVLQQVEPVLGQSGQLGTAAARSACAAIA